MEPPPPDAEVVLDEAAIAALVDRLGREIAHERAGRPVVAVPVLTGALFFATDLVRALRRHGGLVAAIHPVSASSYRDATRPVGPPVVVGCPPRAAIEGRAVLLLDTIVDSGATVEALEAEFRALGAAEVLVACLLDKAAARRRPIAPRFRGVEAPDRFLVGYGLDVAGRFRDWPHVSALRTRPIGPVGSPS